MSSIALLRADEEKPGKGTHPDSSRVLAGGEAMSALPCGGAMAAGVYGEFKARLRRFFFSLCELVDVCTDFSIVRYFVLI